MRMRVSHVWKEGKKKRKDDIQHRPQGSKMENTGSAVQGVGESSTPQTDGQGSLPSSRPMRHSLGHLVATLSPLRADIKHGPGTAAGGEASPLTSLPSEASGTQRSSTVSLLSDMRLPNLIPAFQGQAANGSSQSPLCIVSRASLAVSPCGFALFALFGGLFLACMRIFRS